MAARSAMSDGLDRRDFLRVAIAGGAAAWALGGADESARAAESPARPDAPSPSTTGTGVEGIGRFELAEVGIAELSRRMAAGSETSRSLVEKYLTRIAAVDRAGPTLRSVIADNPEALALADALDAERRQKGPRGPLHGVPILLKDNIATGDRMPTTAGSLALAGFRASQDAFVTAQLRRAGAVVLGKTNLSEWANIRSMRSSSGWSGVGGQTKNPYALDRSPSGSSSGSATAAAASLCAAAVGTETDGSIVSPCSLAGLVGIKPTVGRVSRTGIVPISHTQDTAGPMARTVEDAVLLLAAMEGGDAADPATAQQRLHGLGDVRALFGERSLKGRRIGVPRKGYTGYHPAVDATLESALETLRQLGATLVDPVELPGPAEVGEPEMEVLLHELKADLASWFAWAGPNVPVKSLAEVIAWNRAHADREMALFGQELFEQSEAKGPLTAPAYTEALERCRKVARFEGLERTLDRHKLDACVAATGAPAWVIDPIDGDNYGGGGGSSTIPAVAGAPHIVAPGRPWYGLPMGISFFGRPWSEPGLIRIAWAFEQATHHRAAPGYLPTVALDRR